MMNHPLAMIDSDENNDEDRSTRFGLLPPPRLSNLRDSSSSAHSANSVDQNRSSSPVSHAELDSQTRALANILRAKCAAKRIAPKPPQSAPNLDTDFFIPVEMVRWFYKTEKDKHNHPSSTPAADVKISETTSATLPNDPNNNTIGNKITVVINEFDSI